MIALDSTYKLGDARQFNRFDYGEVRFIILAQIEQRVYVVVYAMQGSAIRLISARKANTREVKRYGNR